LIAGLFSFWPSLVHDVAVAKPARSFHVSGTIDPNQELIMKRLIGAALVAGALWFSGQSAINRAAAAAPHVKAQTSAISGATDLSARQYRRHYHYGYRPHYRPYYQPYYYARPTYYRPYPYYAPAPFPFGFGFGPFW
jgi:hypothetical protein